MWKKFLKSSSALLTNQQQSILSAAFVIMAMTLFSKLLGLIKLRLLIHYFGDSSTTAAFIVASQLPEIFFDIIITSVLSVAFIPVFTNLLAKEDHEGASRLASSVINLTLVIYAIVALVCFLFADQIAAILAAGLTKDADHVLPLTASLIRFMLLAQFFLIVGGYLAAILQSHQRFLVPAIATTLYNISIIIGLLLFAPELGIYAAIVGMLLGGFFQCLVQVPFMRGTHFSYSSMIALADKGVQKIAKLSLPRMLGVMSAQVVDALNIFLATLLSPLAVVSLKFATSLAVVPVSLFGAAIGQAALPALTIAWSKNEQGEYGKLFFASFNQILFFALPTAAVFIVLRLPIVRLLFGDPNFTWESTVMTGRALAMFGLGVVAQSVIMLLARAFYAMQDTKTPVITSVVSLLLNALLAILAVGTWRLPVWSLAAVFTITTVLNAVVLFTILLRRIPTTQVFAVIKNPLKLILCTGAMMLTMYLPLRIMDRYVWEHIHNIGPFALPESFQVFIVDTRYTFNLALLTVVAAGLGGITYLSLAMLLRVPEVTMFQQAFSKLSGVKRILSQSSEVLETDRQVVR